MAFHGIRTKTIVIDLTPMLPGADNGGAKLMTLELVRRMASLAPKTDFKLLTLERSFEELGPLERANVQRVLIGGAVAHNAAHSAALRLVRWMTRPAGLRIQQGIERRLRVLMSRVRVAVAPTATIVSQLGGSVLYCPFTAPFFAEDGVPAVCTIYDLQFADYPQFFDEEDRAQREQNFIEACRRADRLICISDFVRSRVLQESHLPAERVTSIHIKMARRLKRPAAAVSAAVLDALGIVAGRYLLYPANFWKHKNHEMLLVAMGIFYSRSPAADMKLVCTGAPGERLDFIRTSAARMGLGSRVVFPGFVSEAEFSVLMHQSLALIYPSLYEGFGMPVIEAQAMGCPVLCSNAGSLPEVAGKGALIFDPRQPESIAAAIARLDGDPQLRQALREHGLENVKDFQNADAMAAEYLTVLDHAVNKRLAGTLEAANG